MYHVRDFSLEASPHDSRDYIAENIFNTNLKVPRVLDLRKKLKAVRDQGSQGSCAAQSASCMKEYQEKLNVDFNDYMSPQFVYNLRSNTETNGMYLRNVMKILQKQGICPEYDFPYGSKGLPHDFVRAHALNYRIKSYASIKSMDTLKRALYINGPCIIAFPVYNKTSRMWLPEYKGQLQRGGHSMTVVGYNRSGFIIRNSWGIHWGNKGYCVYPYSDWGAHWEVWTTVDDNSEVLKSHSLFPKFIFCKLCH